MTDHISIERLVLHIPGLPRDDVSDLARLVGAQLAGVPGLHGRFATLRITVDPESVADASPASLASLIVAALRRQIG